MFRGCGVGSYLGGQCLGSNGDTYAYTDTNSDTSNGNSDG